MQTVTVTIGRNVPITQNAAARRDGIADTINGTAVLTDDAWQNFTTLVREALEDYATGLGATEWWTESHDGIGEWEGVEEQSRKITVLYAAPALAEGPWSRTELLIALTSARSGFYQDAVAVSFGDSTLV